MIYLDLRNDPGGVLDEAVKVASEFLAGGRVFLSKNADGIITPEPVKPGGLATNTNLPVAVLINGGSASASEIVAGALSDAHPGNVLVGQTTFGTGTVLEQYQLFDGSALLPGGGGVAHTRRPLLLAQGHQARHRGGAAHQYHSASSPLSRRISRPPACKTCGDEQLLRAPGASDD